MNRGMNRLYLFILFSITAVTTVTAIIAISANESSAGILLQTAPPSSDSDSENHYPESRFGYPPFRGDSIELEAQEGENISGDRNLAGFAFNDPSGKLQSNPQSTPVIPDAEMPKTQSNLNPQPSILRGGKGAGVQEVALIASDLGFFPKTLFVTRDIPVKLFVTGASKRSLCVMMDVFQIRRQVRSQKVEEIEFTPAVPGQFRFYCPVNGMEGTLLVKEIGRGGN